MELEIIAGIFVAGMMFGILAWQTVVAGIHHLLKKQKGNQNGSNMQSVRK